jgi:hypothetical protein
MKVALLLNGHIRDLNNFIIIRKFIEKNKNFDIDIYTSTYEILGIPERFDSRSKEYYENSQKITVELLNKYLKFKKIEIENFKEAKRFCLSFAKNHKYIFDSYDSNYDNEFLITNMFSQWRNIYKTFSLIDFPNDYDLIVRYRYDLNAKELDLSSYINSDKIFLRQKGKTFYYRNGKEGPLCFDGCIIGSSESMQKVCKMGMEENYSFLLKNPDIDLIEKNRDYQVSKKPNTRSAECNFIYWCLINELKFGSIKENHLPGSTINRTRKKI